MKRRAPDVDGSADTRDRVRQRVADDEPPIWDDSHPLHEFLLHAMELAKNTSGFGEHAWHTEANKCAERHAKTVQAYLRTAYGATPSKFRVEFALFDVLWDLVARHSIGLLGNKREAARHLRTELEKMVPNSSSPWKGCEFKKAELRSELDANVSLFKVILNSPPKFSASSNPAKGSARP